MHLIIVVSLAHFEVRTTHIVADLLLNLVVTGKIPTFATMTDSALAYKVEITSRLAQWRIDNLASCTYRKSDPFRIGKWNWHLSIEKNRGLFIRLFPEISRDSPPIASFTIRAVLCSARDRKPWTHPDVKDKLLKNNDGFMWAIDQIPIAGKLIIDVDFLDLKIASSNNNQGGEPRSIWGEEGFAQVTSNINTTTSTTLSALGRMLSESILTDITINVSNGSRLRAHRAILATRSPVFRDMFSHKQVSSIDIPNMSIEVCKAFLEYIYGNLRLEEFRAHRTQLLCAAHKYNISELMVSCHDSLLEDIGTSNVLERLQISFLYKLPKLQSGCMRYLVKFGKMYEILDEFNAFLQCGERDLIALIFHEILETWNGF